MRIRTLLLIGALLFQSCVSISQTSRTTTQDVRSFVVEKNVMIPAEDGTLLATDIYRPAVNGVAISDPRPILLQRTPYNKEAERFVPKGAYFSSQGYVVAIQDLRGLYGSKGLFTKYSSNEASDGAATIKYLAKLPYVDGRVATWGTSYGAHTQADASKLDPEGLAAMVLNMGGMTNAWDHAVRQGGAFELGRELTWAFRQIPAENKNIVVQSRFDVEKINDWYTALPFRKGLNPLSIVPNFEDYFLEEMTHSDYDDFWKRTGINWVEYYGQTADVPMVHIGGWYDIFLKGTIQNYLTLDSLQSSPKWLIIGPWTHSGNERTYSGDVDFGSAAAIADFRMEYQLRWMDYLLKGIRSEDIPEKPIKLFVMGGGDGRQNTDGRLNHGGRWIEADSWPLPDLSFTSYKLNGDGSLSLNTNSSYPTSTSYDFDPLHPVPTMGGSVSARVKDGGFNQRERPDFIGSSPPYLPISARRDVVVFQTEPLEEDVEVIGPITVKLYCSSDGSDTDFTIKLVDVYPPSEDYPSGFDLNITDGVVRMSYRNERHSRDLIRPDSIYEVTIQPFATANVFKKGHRIRLDVSSSNFPRWDVNPNTGEPLGKSRRMRVAKNTIYHSAAYPSEVLLPVKGEE